MRVMITGAAGLVGSALASAYGDVVALTHRDLDIADARAVEAAVQQHRPEAIFNCAVIAVDDCERDPRLAERVNVDGPMLLAQAAERIGAAIVHFSTNYVFDGDRDNVPYTVDDEAKPINVYGVTKLRGERAVLAANPRAFVIRTSWVFGEGKNSFLSTVAAKLQRGERVQAITDTFASTTYVHDLVARVQELVSRGAAGTHHVVNDGVCTNETFAREAARLTGASEALIEPVSEAQMQRLAPRPRWTPMRCEPPMRRWEDALAAYVTSPRVSS